jgi:hypothetical protein
MKDLPPNDDLLKVARAVIWFEPPEQALAKPFRFLTYLMTYGTKGEVNVVMRYLTVDDFREALENALPGIFDEDSWIYWNTLTRRVPIPPMPVRIIPDEA